MKRLSVITFQLTLAAILAMAQTATPAPATPAVTVASLPAYTVGAGPSWTRGGASPYSLDTTVGVHIGQSRWISWTNISTPVSVRCVPATGTPCPPSSALPVASSFGTGGAYVPIQTASGAVSLVFIVQIGFSALETTSTIAPAFGGSFGIAFRLGKSNAYLFPYVKIANATTSATSGALATAVLQPGFQVLYGFGGK